jgi:hypothetical protein
MAISQQLTFSHHLQEDSEMKFCETCGDEIFTRDSENRCAVCEEGLATKAKKERAKANRKAKEEILKSLGLVKVRGALGGVYWE